MTDKEIIELQPDYIDPYTQDLLRAIGDTASKLMVQAMPMSTRNVATAQQYREASEVIHGQSPTTDPDANKK